MQMEQILSIPGFYSCWPQHCPVDASSLVFSNTFSQMPLKRFTAHDALTQILADDSEDIDASDYGNDIDFESGVSVDSCHYSNSRSESDAAKPTAM